MMNDHKVLRAIKHQYDVNVAWTSSDAEELRAQYCVGLVPPGVDSLCDIGCGDGRISNRLSGHVPVVVGVDVSEAALARVRGWKTAASADCLPFRDRAFDVVTMFEILEHLPAALCARVCEEAMRVANRYIIVTVPNREPLYLDTVQCGRCGCRYNGWGHLSRWTPQDLRRLFGNRFAVRGVGKFGARGRNFGICPDALYRLMRERGGRWRAAGHAVCPRCYSAERFVSEGNLLGQIMEPVLWRCERAFARLKRAWLWAIYERSG